MTPAQHDPERDLNRTLSRQADRFAQHGTPLELDAVLNRAGEIRRGRRMRATLVMAAVVLAIAVPVGITTLNENDPTKQKEVAPAVTTDDSPISLGGFDNGAAPKTGYVLDGTLRYAGKQTQVGDVSYLARINGGFLVGAAEKVRFVADEGDGPTKTWALGEGFAVSPEKNVGAFTEPDGTVVAVQDGGALFFDVGKLPAGNTYRTVGVSGENCSGRSEEIGCTIWVSEVDETPATWKVSPNVAPEKVDNEGRIAVDGAGNYVRQLTLDTLGGGNTYAFFDAAGKEIWRSSEYRPEAFSPDGTRIIAGPAYQSGGGDNSLTVLDAATGTPQLDLQVVTGSDTDPQVTVVEVVWEDDGHILATIAEGSSMGVLRFDLNGKREYALPEQTVEDPFGSSPFKLG